MARRLNQGTKYNEAFFRSMGGPGPTAVGLFVVLLIVFGFYLAFAKQLPFTGNGYELTATFQNAANIRTKSPVRIAGVNVGEVKSVQRDGANSKVTFTVSNEGRPIHDDAFVKIRPRIFLEGNFFLDIDPGSPSKPELGNDGSIPVSHTATAVQLDEVLNALQAPQRQNLRELLQGFGTALTHTPTAAEDLTQDPDVQGLSGAQALNKAFDYGAAAGKNSAIVNQSLLGTRPHDLSGLIRGLDRTFGALAAHELPLEDLITNFNTTTGALADESQNLSNTVRLLAPTLTTARSSLVHLNQTLPFLRTFAIELRPGIAQLPATIRAADPWLTQVKPLLSNAELGGLAKLLRKGTPGLSGATGEGLTAFPKLTALSNCVANVLIPAGDQVINDSSFGTGEPNYREAFYGFTDLAGESQNFDANGPYVRFQSGGGPTRVRMNNPNGSAAGSAPANKLTGFNISPLLGSQPALGPKPQINHKVACASQQVPALNGPAAQPGPPTPQAVP
jgi:phospholipid/cholesterol/gamma-HCH transport system substrate-binding protein